MCSLQAMNLEPSPFTLPQVEDLVFQVLLANEEVGDFVREPAARQKLVLQLAASMMGSTNGHRGLTGIALLKAGNRKLAKRHGVFAYISMITMTSGVREYPFEPYLNLNLCDMYKCVGPCKQQAPHRACYAL
jgi:hypothetical protein